MDIAIPALRAYLRHFPVRYKKGGIYYKLLQPLLENRSRVRTVSTVAGIFRCDTQDVVQRYIWLWGQWEPVHTSYVRSFLKNGDVFVDVGANVGWFTVLAGNLGARVVSFEPLPSIFAALNTNVELNGLHPRLVNAAIADEEGEIPVYRASDANSGLSTTEPGRGHAFEAVVPVFPLHRALSDEEIARARLIKVDTEGAAVKAALGLLPILKSHNIRPDLEILMELDVSDDPDAPRQVTEMFVGAGFKPYALRNDYQPDMYMRRLRSFEAPRCDPSAGCVADVLFSRRDEPVIRWTA